MCTNFEIFIYKVYLMFTPYLVTGDKRRLKKNYNKKDLHYHLHPHHNYTHLALFLLCLLSYKWETFWFIPVM